MIHTYLFNFRTDLITKGAYIINLVARLIGVVLCIGQITVLVKFGRIQQNLVRYCRYCKYYGYCGFIDIVYIADIADIGQYI